MLESIKYLREIEAIVPDGDWEERFLGRLMDPDPKISWEAGFEAIADFEVLLPAPVAYVLCLEPSINKAASATVLRRVWTDQGFQTTPDILRKMFTETATLAPNYLMNKQEWAVLAALPDVVTIFRGQLFDSGKKLNGASWTLLKEVAQWYSAPCAALNSRDRGWVLTAKIPKSAILAVFFDRDEKEVVVDIEQIPRSSVEVQRGTCDKFPKHLAKSQLGFVGSISSSLGL